MENENRQSIANMKERTLDGKVAVISGGNEEKTTQ
jgi:hypothetical protein